MLWASVVVHGEPELIDANGEDGQEDLKHHAHVHELQAAIQPPVGSSSIRGLILEQGGGSNLLEL